VTPDEARGGTGVNAAQKGDRRIFPVIDAGDIKTVRAHTVK
jgi:hypothetical protein